MSHRIKASIALALLAVSLTSCATSPAQSTAVSVDDTPKFRTTVWDDNSILYPVDTAGNSIIVYAAPATPMVKLSNEASSLEWADRGWITFTYNPQNIAEGKELALYSETGEVYSPIEQASFTTERTVAFLVPKADRAKYLLGTQTSLSTMAFPPTL